MQVCRVAVIPTQITLIHRLGIVHKIAIKTTSVLVGQKFCRQLKCFGNLQWGKAQIGMAHGLVVHPFIEITLQHQKLAQVCPTPPRPVVRSKQHFGIATKQQQAFVDVL